MFDTVCLTQSRRITLDTPADCYHPYVNDDGLRVAAFVPTVMRVATEPDCPWPTTKTSLQASLASLQERQLGNGSQARSLINNLAQVRNHPTAETVHYCRVIAASTLPCASEVARLLPSVIDKVTLKILSTASKDETSTLAGIATSLWLLFFCFA